MSALRLILSLGIVAVSNGATVLQASGDILGNDSDGVWLLLSVTDLRMAWFTGVNVTTSGASVQQFGIGCYFSGSGSW